VFSEPVASGTFHGIPLITVSISNRQKTLPVDRRRIRQAVRSIVCDARVTDAKVGVAVVDDSTIAQLHGEFLNDPTPTDVLGFVLERSEQMLEGEVVVSADTALASAPKYGLPAERELLLYVIHGTLHLVGYDDTTPRQRAVMRKKEREYLAQSDV
jgi:probable rRNA maturation factor